MREKISKKEAKEAFERLLTIASGRSLPICREDKRYWQYSDKFVENNNIPLFSEYTLYTLLGKDDARSILHYLREIGAYLGSKEEL